MDNLHPYPSLMMVAIPKLFLCNRSVDAFAR
jgi:hypothetical protein